MDIQWQRGKFIKFYAKMKIRVGGANNVDIFKGDEFEYDGSILKYLGAEISTPQTRSAIKAGWATTEPDDSPVASKIVPNRNVAKATSVNSDLNRVQRVNSGNIMTDSLDEETVMDVQDRRPDGKSNLNASPRTLTKENVRGLRSQQHVDDSQEGVTVGTVRTSAKLVTNVANSRQTASIRDSLENLSGSGYIPSATNHTVVKEGVSVTTNIGSMNRGSSAVAFEEDGTVVGKIQKGKTITSEGIEIKDTSTIRNNPKAGKAKAAAAPAEKEKAPAAPAINTSMNPRIRIARCIDPSFPVDWSFTGKLAERLEAVRNRGATPLFLEALYAAEGDQMRKLLQTEFPGQFG